MSIKKRARLELYSVVAAKRKDCFLKKKVKACLDVEKKHAHLSKNTNAFVKNRKR